MPAAVPNKNNKPDLSTAQSNEANNSIKNFIQGLKLPPTTAGDRDKMKAAIEAFKDQIKKTKTQSAKHAKGGAGAPPAALLAAQTDKVGKEVADLAKFLPAGANLANISFAEAIKSMENAIAQMELLIKNPTGAGTGTDTTK